MNNNPSQNTFASKFNSSFLIKKIIDNIPTIKAVKFVKKEDGKLYIIEDENGNYLFRQ